MLASSFAFAVATLAPNAVMLANPLAAALPAVEPLAAVLTLAILLLPEHRESVSL